VLVTGAASGFGRNVTEKLLARGVTVYATDVNMDLLKEVFQPRVGDNLQLFKLDITKQEDIDRVAAEIEKRGNELYGLVNNAGIASVNGSAGMCLMHEFQWQNISKVYEINVFGMIKMTNKFLPLLRKSQGAIVNLASVAGFIPGPYMGYYSSTKYAVLSYSDCLRQELLPLGVRVITIEPGFAETALLKDIRDVSADPNSEFFSFLDSKLKNRAQAIDKFNPQSPLNVAQVISDSLFLESPEAHYIIDNLFNQFFFGVILFTPPQLKALVLSLPEKIGQCIKNCCQKSKAQ